MKPTFKEAVKECNDFNPDLWIELNEGTMYHYSYIEPGGIMLILTIFEDGAVFLKGVDGSITDIHRYPKEEIEDDLRGELHRNITKNQDMA